MDQFAGHKYYDNSAVCLTCGHQHLLPKGEGLGTQAWLDWLHKHDGHENFIVPTRLLSRLGERQAQLVHNADRKIAYAASAAYTITLTGLATSSTLVAGREGSSLSNASNKYLDELVAGQIMVGTTPTASTNIEVDIVAALDDTPTWPDVFDGTDSAETVSNVGIKAAICVPVALIAVPANTSDLGYPFGPRGIRQFFGDALPVAHVPFVTHSTAVNLNATAANHFIKHTPVYETIA